MDKKLQSTAMKVLSALKFRFGEVRYRLLRIWWAILDRPIVAGVNIEAGTLRILPGPPTLVRECGFIGPLPVGVFVSRGSTIILDHCTFRGFDLAIQIEKVEDLLSA